MTYSIEEICHCINRSLQFKYSDGKKKIMFKIPYIKLPIVKILKPLQK